MGGVLIRIRQREEARPSLKVDLGSLLNYTYVFITEYTTISYSGILSHYDDETGSETSMWDVSLSSVRSWNLSVRWKYIQ